MWRWRAQDQYEDDGLRLHEAIAIAAAITAGYVTFFLRLCVDAEWVALCALFVIPAWIYIAYRTRLAIPATYFVFVGLLLTLFAFHAPSAIAHQKAHAELRRSFAGGPPRTAADAMGLPIPTDFQIHVDVLVVMLQGLLTWGLASILIGEVARYLCNTVVAVVSSRRNPAR